MRRRGEGRSSARELAEAWAREGRNPHTIELATLLRRVTAQVTGDADAVLAARGLSRGQFDVLAALHRARKDSGAGLTQAELADQMTLSPPGMQKRLATLYELGLLERDVDPADARRLVIRLSASGQELLDGVLDAFFDAEDRSLRGLNSRDRSQLIRLLRRMTGDDDRT
ncbi:MarR family transcriptional regulator [Brooklawnia cerclae]|uniref:DNA-binding MarR family transcriptional regulator n=1 Tax=Brooklawnia cerclae TaxID=349934 RepID=A0ABX0SEI9_9ACTN|nr:DNA-binding MarR family transcriptional regulator [Brooklawnia cerclae]